MGILFAHLYDFAIGARGEHINVQSDAGAGATVTVYLPPYNPNRDGTS